MHSISSRRALPASKTALVTAMVLLSGCLGIGSDDSEAVEEPLTAQAVEGGGGGKKGGGKVDDVAGSLATFVASVSSVENDVARPVLFTTSLFDPNGEQDLKDHVLSFSMTGPGTASSTRTLEKNEVKDETAAPSTVGGDGWMDGVECGEKGWDGFRRLRAHLCRRRT